MIAIVVAVAVLVLTIVIVGKFLVSFGIMSGNQKFYICVFDENVASCCPTCIFEMFCQDFYQPLFFFCRFSCYVCEKANAESGAGVGSLFFASLHMSILL